MSNGSTSVTTRSSSPYENDPNSPASRSHLSSNPSLSDSTQSTPATTPGSISFLQKPAQLTREQSFSGQSPASDDFSPTSLIPSHLASQISTQAYAVPPSPPSSHRPRWTPASVTSAVPLVEPYTIQPTPTLPVSQSDPTAHIARSALPQSSLHSSYIEQPQNDSQGATTNLQNALSSPQVVRSPLSNDALGAHAHATVFAEETKSSSKTKTVLKVIRKGAKVVAKGVAKAAGYGIEYTTNIPVNDLAAYLALLFEPNRKSKRQSLRADLQLVLEGALHAPYDDVIKELEKAKKRQMKRSKQSTLVKGVLELARKQQANARQQREQASQAPQLAPASHIQPVSQRERPINNHVPYDVPDSSMSGIPLSTGQQSSSTSSHYGVSPSPAAETHSAPLSASGAHHHSAQKSRTEGDDVEQELADLGSWMSIDDDGQDGD
ncbi:hypothetical protein H0H92_002522 [Tricholoma furcatifolium]|nr:hypothetical protein H0H92_002522 [Tricholoma furcatifolium]